MFYDNKHNESSDEEIPIKSVDSPNKKRKSSFEQFLKEFELGHLHPEFMKVGISKIEDLAENDEKKLNHVLQASKTVVSDKFAVSQAVEQAKHTQNLISGLDDEFK